MPVPPDLLLGDDEGDDDGDDSGVGGADCLEADSGREGAGSGADGATLFSSGVTGGGGGGGTSRCGAGRSGRAAINFNSGEGEAAPLAPSA